MAKKDDIILIIAKSFGKERFTKEETKISKELTVLTLVKDYGLNDIQAQEVIKHCVLSCASLEAERQMLEKEVLEEGLFSFLDKFKKNKVEIAFRSLMHTKSNSIGIPEFLRDVSTLLSTIHQEGGIQDYRDNKKDHPPESDWNIQRLKKIAGKLLALETEFRKAVPSSARKIKEYFEPETKNLNQKAASMKIMMKIGKYLDDGSYDTLSQGYYDRGLDITRMVRPLLRRAGQYKFQGKYKLSRKEVHKLAYRFELFIKHLIEQLNEELVKYTNAVDHGSAAYLSRNMPRPRQTDLS